MEQLQVKLFSFRLLAVRREAVSVLHIQMVESPEGLKEQRCGLGQGRGWARAVGSLGRGEVAW